MAKQNNSLVWGSFLVLTGAVLLVANLSTFDVGDYWPVFIVLGGLAFGVGYLLDRRNYGLLMPASILLVIGLLFLYCSLFEWDAMENLWPVFILAPAVGFIAMYFGGEREKGLLIPAGILSVIGLLFLFMSSGLGDFWPLFLIAAGVLLIAMDMVSRKKNLPKK
jgi:hypothetical protein